jgi:superfamily II DNA or RNA helicase
MKNSRWARDKLQLIKVNEVYLKVVSEASVVQELSEHLTFMVPGAKFSPAYKNKFWDGKIRLLNSLTGLTYAGLVKEISEFAASRNYDVEVDPELQSGKLLDDKHLDEYISNLSKISPRDYQRHAFNIAITSNRAIFLSPTASGKSLIIYLIACYYLSILRKQRVLVIVPTVSLVLQMKKDFEEYAGHSLDIHCITAGVDKVTTSPMVISTWQSIYKMPKDWFKQFGCVIGDEVHQFKATSLKSIMEKLIDCKYRFGFTGTLDGSLTNKITLEGLFGSIKQVTTSSELMEQGHIANLKIKALVLKHDSESRKLVRKFSYQDEIDFIVRHEKRNKFIRNLTLSLEGNTLVLFQFVEKHGKVLFDMMKTKDPDRKIYFVHGGVEGDDRERIRGIVEKESNAIIVASYGTFSTGINIRNLHSVVLASPSKSRVRILQSIGRGLRIGDSKDTMTLYDIADDLKSGSQLNFTLQHFTERLNIYNSEGFEYKIFNTEL